MVKRFEYRRDGGGRGVLPSINWRGATVSDQWVVGWAEKDLGLEWTTDGWSVCMASEAGHAVVGRFAAADDRPVIRASRLPDYVFRQEAWARVWPTAAATLTVLWAAARWGDPGNVKYRIPPAKRPEDALPVPHAVVAPAQVGRWLSWASTAPEVVAAAVAAGVQPAEWLRAQALSFPSGAQAWPCSIVGGAIGQAFGARLAWRVRIVGYTDQGRLDACLWPVMRSPQVPRRVGTLPLIFT